MTQLPVYDHFLYGGLDLDALSTWFEQASGVRPVVGGRHPGLGTHNALAQLGAGCYFELLAPDPTQSGGSFGDMLKAAPRRQLFAYMLRAADLGDLQRRYASVGVSCERSAASRTKPDGEVLRWELLIPHADHPMGHLLPKFIAWGDGVTHPSAATPAGCLMRAFALGHPDAGRLRAIIDALGLSMAVLRTDHPWMQLDLDTPKGTLRLVGLAA